MCGIVATRGRQAGAAALAGLTKLEYRGYDSAGLAVVGDGGRLRIERTVGPLDALVTRIAGNVQLLDPPGRLAIGHTRWATHGAVHVHNAHPLRDCTGRIAVVHNGVLENFTEVRDELRLSGHWFRSDVDSELIPHLIEHEMTLGAEPFDAVRKAVARMQGSWAIAVLVEGLDALLLARRRSPLMLRGTPRQFVVASDPVATMDVPGPLRVLADGDIAELGRRWRWVGPNGSDRPPAIRVERSRRVAGTAATAIPRPAVGHASTASEIREQHGVATRLVDEILTRCTSPHPWRRFGLPHPERVLLLGCGTSYHAALVTARVLRLVAGLPATAVIASEYDRRFEVPFDLTVAISQSGETADVLTALESIDTPVLAITNNTYSSVARIADAVIDCRAGVERGVAATKTFTAQLLCGTGLALAAAVAVGAGDRADAAARLLARVPDQLAAAEARGNPINDAETRMLARASGWLFLGTGSGVPYASEGALKLKEITYRWAQSYPAAELKHGPLALVQRGTPAVVIDNGAPRLTTTVAEVRARGAEVIVLRGHHGMPSTEFADGPPWGPIDTVPALQYLAVSIANVLGRDVDRPRNLAKSVTVG
jgi:glucosamine--fructose-6-phosphate aminotransferase (isomerizing)